MIRLLRWTASESFVEGYNVYIKSNGEFVKHNETVVAGTTYDVSEFEAGEYEAYITAVLGDLESAPSNTVAFIIITPDSTTFVDTFTYASQLAMLETWKFNPSSDGTATQLQLLSLDGVPPNGIYGTGIARHNEAEVGQGIFYVDNIGYSDSSEVLGLIKVVENTVNAVNLIIGSSATTRTFFRAVPFISSNNVTFSKVVNGTNTAIASAATTLTANTWYWLRFRLTALNATDVNIKIKIWARSLDEPSAWLLDENYNVGGALIGFPGMRFFWTASSMDRQIDYFAATHDPLSMPIPVPAL